MKKIACLWILLCPLWNKAQERGKERPLELGAYLQEIKCTKLLNSTAASMNSTDYRDKLLVLDFWATWCGACIREFPRLDSLQHRYSDKLRVWLVSSPGNDPEEKIRRFFSERRNAAGKKMDLPVIYGEGLLDQLFPHQAIPHSVWIYKGKFYAVTRPGELSAENIEQLFAGGRPVLENIAPELSFDPACSLQEQGWPLPVMHQDKNSLLAAYVPGAGVKAGTTPPSAGMARRYYVNMPLMALVAQAWPQVPANRILPLQGMEAELSTVHNTGWKQQHWFSFEYRFPAGIPEAQRQCMLQAYLQDAFQICIQTEKRVVPCYAVICTGDGPRQIPSATDTAFTRQLNGNWSMHNQPVTALLTRLNYQSPGKPLVPVVLDETGGNRLYSMEFPFPDLQDLSCIKEVLRQQGLDIIPVKRELEFLTIRPAFHYQKSN